MSTLGSFRPQIRPGSQGRSSIRPVAMSSWIPDYGIPMPGKIKPKPSTPSSKPGVKKSLKNWWDYTIPNASIGAPRIGMPSITIPVYGMGGGSGGKGGWGFGGGGGGGGNSGGSGGDAMAGYTYLFGLLVLMGGATAYYRKGSSKSLIASSGITILLFISASLMGKPGSQVGSQVGLLLALATCLVLAGLLGYRSYKYGKIVPAGVISILSAAMSVGYIKTLTN